MPTASDTVAWNATGSCKVTPAAGLANETDGGAIAYTIGTAPLLGLAPRVFDATAAKLMVPSVVSVMVAVKLPLASAVTADPVALPFTLMLIWLPATAVPVMVRPGVRTVVLAAGEVIVGAGGGDKDTLTTTVLTVALLALSVAVTVMVRVPLGTRFKSSVTL